MPDNENTNGWNSWKNYVIKTLEKIESRQDKIENAHHLYEIDSSKDIVELQTRIKVNSAVISFVVAIIINIFSAFFINNYIQNQYEEDLYHKNIIIEELQNELENR